MVTLLNMISHSSYGSGRIVLCIALVCKEIKSYSVLLVPKGLFSYLIMSHFKVLQVKIYFCQDSCHEKVAQALLTKVMHEIDHCIDQV